MSSLPPPEPSEPLDVIILGGGAAGLLCAAEAAKRHRRVLILEQGAKPAPKILVSGGGRCNFTNLHATPKNYLSSNPGFMDQAFSRFRPKDFIKLVKEQGIAYHEKKDGQLFCDKSAKEIIELLVQKATVGGPWGPGAQLKLGQKVEEVTHQDGVFTVRTHSRGIQAEGGTLQDQAQGEPQTATPKEARSGNIIYSAPRLVVATGGLSWPQLGATDIGFKIAAQFGLAILQPEPALVGLTFPTDEMERFKDLAGIHLNAKVCFPLDPATGTQWKMQEDLMITHQGLSGPVMLNASLYWKPGQEITVNWVPELTAQETFERLKKDKATGGRGSFRTWIVKRIPKRLAERIAWHAQARGAWSELSDEKLLAVAKAFHEYRFTPSGTFGYRMAEVTRGGVDTREIDPQTMECKKVPGLFFIGEVLDVTGQLGGFNFQWAWASGYAAGRVV